MNKNRGGRLKNADILRQKAEAAFKERQSHLDSVRSESDILRLVHELEVHQIELEMQNDELLLAKEQAELATAKYEELYEFAPSGYFILSSEGKIIQLNIAGSQIFGRDRSQLKNHRFAFFVSDESKSVFKLFLSRIFSSSAKQTCDLSLSIPNNQPMQVHVTGLVEPDKDECFVTMVDLTERKRNEKEIILANEELAFQNEEKAKRAAELVIANRELDYQKEEKSKRAAELDIVNKELAYQNEEKAKRAAELDIANKELVIRIEENNRQYSEQIGINRLIAFQRDRLEEIVSLVPGVVYQYRLRPDGSSCFPYASEAIKQIYRVTPEEVREDATKVFANLHPDDHAGMIASIQASAKKLTPWQHELRVKFDDGTIRTLFGNALPRLEKDGSVLWHGFITDITERKLAEDFVRESQARYSSMIANISDVITITDSDGVIKYESPNIERLFGWLPEERTGMSGFSVIHPDDIENVQKEFLSLLGEDDSVKTLEFRLKCKDGIYKPIELTAANLLNDPIINGVLLNYRDISRRKQSEEEKAHQVSLINSLLDSIPDIIFFKDTEGVYLGCNPPFAAFVGKSRSEIIGKTDYDLFDRETADSFRFFDHEMLKQKLPRRNEEWITYPDGRKILIDTLKTPYWAAEGRLIGMLGISRDITERKIAEQEIKLKNKELQKVNAEKDKFFSIISHDLRGPLGGFMGLTKMMADENLYFTEPEIKEITLELSRSASNTFNLLENLLEWSQIDRGLTKFKPLKLGLTDVVTECRNIVTEQARGKRIALIVDIPTGYEVFADKYMLQTVIRNLLSNAIKFTPPGGRVTISSKPAENNRMVISVSDTGIGMSDQMRDNLFSIGVNTRRPGTEGEKSTGLGLLLCKEFVEKHGGKISIKSEQNHGTVFSFTISSAGEQQEKNIPEEVLKAGDALKSIDNLKILIAEDDEISAKLISVMVKGFSREVLQTKTGNGAVQICLANPDIDLIMMDIGMPGLDGYEATRQIRQFNQKVIILAQTTFVLREDRENALAAGCNDCITKPFSKDTVIELIKKYI